MFCDSQCSVFFLTASWVCLRCVLMVFPDHTHCTCKDNHIVIIPYLTNLNIWYLSVVIQIRFSGDMRDQSKYV